MRTGGNTHNSNGKRFVENLLSPYIKQGKQKAVNKFRAELQKRKFVSDLLKQYNVPGLSKGSVLDKLVGTTQLPEIKIAPMTFGFDKETMETFKGLGYAIGGGLALKGLFTYLSNRK